MSEQQAERNVIKELEHFIECDLPEPALEEWFESLSPEEQQLAQDCLWMVASQIGKHFDNMKEIGSKTFNALVWGCHRLEFKKEGR